MKVTAQPRTDSRGREIFQGLGFGPEGMRAGRLGEGERSTSIWDVEIVWHDGRLDSLVYDDDFGALADYIKRTSRECSNLVKYGSNGNVKAIRVGNKEYRIRNSKQRRGGSRNDIYVK